MMRPSAIASPMRCASADVSGSWYSTAVIWDMNCTGPFALVVIRIASGSKHSMSVILPSRLVAPSGCAHESRAQRPRPSPSRHACSRVVSAPSSRTSDPRERTVERVVAQRLRRSTPSARRRRPCRPRPSRSWPRRYRGRTRAAVRAPARPRCGHRALAGRAGRRGRRRSRGRRCGGRGIRGSRSQPRA